MHTYQMKNDPRSCKRNLTTPVGRSNQLSYIFTIDEATDVGRWSVTVLIHVPVQEI